jgi:type I restriction enzyme, S subunit
VSVAGGAFAVGFRELERWDVTFFRGVSWQWPAEYIMPLGAVALRKRIEVEDAQGLASIPIIEKISFGGIISITEPEDRIDYKGRLFWAETGDLIYSKIRVKQGSLAIVPAEIKRIAVSAEYPVYTIRTGHAVPDYLELVLRTRSFLQLLDGLAHGGSTKTRIPPEDFERLDIPVPPLEMQRAIVARWQAAQAEADAAEERVKQVQAEIESRFLCDLGLEASGSNRQLRTFAVSWRKVVRWSVGHNQATQSGTDLTHGKHPVVELGSVLEMIQYGTSAKANSSGNGTQVIRMNNIVDGSLDLSDMKYVDLSPPATRRATRHRGTHPGRPRRDHPPPRRGRTRAPRRPRRGRGDDPGDGAGCRKLNTCQVAKI